MIHSSLAFLDNAAACRKIVGSGLDFGKSSPLTLCEKNSSNPKRLKTREIVLSDADEAKINSKSSRYKSLIKCSTPEISSNSGLVSKDSLNNERVRCSYYSNTLSMPKLSISFRYTFLVEFPVKVAYNSSETSIPNPTKCLK